MTENERYHEIVRYFKADAMKRCLERDDPAAAATLMLSMLPFCPPGSVFADGVNEGVRQGCDTILSEKQGTVN